MTAPLSCRLPALLVTSLLLAGCATSQTPATQPAVAAACPDDAGVMEGWDTPAPAQTLHGNVHFVGTCGISAVLLTSPAGHILIDGGTTAGAPAIAASIQSLGYRLQDVRYLLLSHEHEDHAGGLAALQQASGAVVVARPAAVATLRSGTVPRDDPQFGQLDDFQAVKAVQTIEHGQTLQLGPLILTAHATPGHAPGSTSWSWQSCADGLCLDMVYADSLSAAAAPGYRYSDHPDRLAAFRTSLQTVAALPCDVLITPHPLASDLFARMAGNAGLIDPQACQRYAAAAHTALQARLAAEVATGTP